MTMTYREIVLTAEQLDALRAVQTKTRYEALDAVAEILGAKMGYRGTWGGTSRKTIIIDKLTTADITWSKGRVKDLDFYTREPDVSYRRLVL